MQGAPNTSHEVAYTIGQLRIGGDWACAHGDVSALRDIALRLAGRLPEPLHYELTALAEQCNDDPDRAAARWPALKEQLFRSGGS